MMPRPCSICTGPNRHAIDEAIRGGESERIIAARFGTSQSTVHRHKECPPLPETIDTVRQAVDALDTISEAVELLQEAKRLKAEAPDHAGAIAGQREVREAIKLLASIKGLTDDGTSITIINADMQILMGRVREAVCPVCRAKVIELTKELERC
jgi:hypothetical protein